MSLNPEVRLGYVGLVAPSVAPEPDRPPIRGVAPSRRLGSPYCGLDLGHDLLNFSVLPETENGPV